MSTGAELISLMGGEDLDDNDMRSSPDEVFTGGQVERYQANVPQLQLVSGVGSWVKKNPVIAGALALAAIYLVYRVVKKRR